MGLVSEGLAGVRWDSVVEKVCKGPVTEERCNKKTKKGCCPCRCFRSTEQKENIGSKGKACAKKGE